jgi:Xaa-Pro aminopeptidase
VKLPGETAMVQRAVDETEALFETLARAIRIGMSAREIGGMFHREADRLGVPTAWARRHCPTVTVGPHSPIGHVAPGVEKVEDGCLVHVDFGIVRDGYCSDLQRLWWVRSERGPAPPQPVGHAYETIVQGIELAAQALRPGLAGWEVDAKVREHLIARGYPEYAHALGHHLGRAVHDGGGVLGPRWERYGHAPFEAVRVGNLYTLEPSIHLPAYGLVSLEEDVTVTPDGTRFLSRFPRELPILTTR